MQGLKKKRRQEKPFANAKRLLPKALYEEIKKYYKGGNLYVEVPKYNVTDENRNQVTVQMAEQGFSIQVISMVIRRTKNQVYRILKKEWGTSYFIKNYERRERLISGFEEFYLDRQK